MQDTKAVSYTHLQVIQFLFQIGKTQTGDFKFFCHIQNPFSDKNIDSSRYYRRIMPHSQVLFAVFGERMSARGRVTGGRWYGGKLAADGVSRFRPVLPDGEDRGHDDDDRQNGLQSQSRRIVWSFNKTQN